MTNQQPVDQDIPVGELAYEQAFAKLEDIVIALESGEHPLEDALALFEHGQALIQRCSTLLDQAELKVQQVLSDKLVDFPTDN